MQNDDIDYLRERYCSLLDGLISKTVGLSQNKIAKGLKEKDLSVGSATISILRTKGSAGQYNRITKDILTLYGGCVKETKEGMFIALKRYIPPPPVVKGIKYHDVHIEKLLEEHANKGEKQLRVLDTWIEVSDFFLNWLKRTKLETVEVLVLHPFSNSFVQRAEGISATKGDVERIRQAYLEILRNIVERPYYGDRLKVRLYNELPGFNAYFIGSSVYFAPYLMHQSSYNNFYLGTSSETNLINKLDAHFKLLWSKDNSIELTSKLVDEFEQKKRITSPLCEEYVMYNLDESPEAPYQIAVIKLDKGQKSAQLIYTNRKTGNKEVVQGSVVFLEVPNHVFFSFRKGAFILDILCYYVRTSFIQAVYLHTDHEGRPRTSFAIIEQQRENSPVLPSRNAEDMPEEIRRFLMNRFEYTPQIKDDFRDRSNLNSETINYNLVRMYVGIWVLYYNVRLGENKLFKDNPAAGEIAKSVLIIEEDKLSGKISCSMDAHDGRKFEGELMYNRHLANSDHILGIMLHNKPKKDKPKGSEKRILNLIFDTNLNLGDSNSKSQSGIKETLPGTYNITYSNRTQGCGFAILKWVSPTEHQKPGVIDPLSEEGRNIPLPLQHLAFKKTGLWAPYDLEQIQSIKPYSGIYNMYNYGIKIVGDQEKWAVILSAIEITDFGLVIFKGLGGIQAHGSAQVHNGNLYIELQSTSQTNRIGYFILYVGDNKTIEDGMILTGVYIGITIHDRIPIGKRVILEKTSKKYEDINPQKFLTLESEQVDIPERIRKVLAGNLKNVIGFLKKRNKIFNQEGLHDEIESTENLGHRFYEAACFKILKAVNQSGDTRLQNAVNEAVKILSKAISHGFTDLDVFKAEVKSMGEKAYQKIIENQEFKLLERIAANFGKRQDDKQ